MMTVHLSTTCKAVIVGVVALVSTGCVGVYGPDVPPPPPPVVVAPPPPVVVVEPVPVYVPHYYYWRYRHW
jgi:hypothetical protein